MEEGNTRDLEIEKPMQHEFFSKVIRAGRRTYFFDVKATLSNDYYITIKESKKVINQDGHAFFERHKIFLYPEDFDKFSEGLSEIINWVQHMQPKTLTPQKHNLIKAEMQIEANYNYHNSEKKETVEEI